jgi:hypothetical protein
LKDLKKRFFRWLASYLSGRMSSLFSLIDSFPGAGIWGQAFQHFEGQAFRVVWGKNVSD